MYLNVRTGTVWFEVPQHKQHNMQVKPESYLLKSVTMGHWGPISLKDLSNTELFTRLETTNSRETWELPLKHSEGMV